MSRFLYHESCPNCGSKDNLGVWDDDHKFCFGCNYYIPGKNKLPFIKTISQETSNLRGFPIDSTTNIPSKPLIWLLSCGISTEDIEHYGIMWSEYQQLLCWKLSDTIWQGRYFKESKNKYISQGLIHESIFILGDTLEGSLVLVEDYMSAIRVSKYSPCMPLFGCVISIDKLQAIKKRFKGLKVWLDSDKLDNARKIALNANLIGLDTKVIYTEKDPKNFTSTKIQEIINEV